MKLISARDFDPDTLNLKSKGKVVTVYIELPEGYDVEETDISTVMLNGIVPALAHPTDAGDYDSDGVSDLMVKFDRSDVQDVLEPGNEVEVTVSGQLTDGTSFEGADTIRVIAKGKKEQRKCVSQEWSPLVWICCVKHLLRAIIGLLITTGCLPGQTKSETWKAVKDRRA